jgi:hypothetical protein
LRKWPLPAPLLHVDVQHVKCLMLIIYMARQLQHRSRNKEEMTHENQPWPPHRTG